jgi:hypothetical protein
METLLNAMVEVRVGSSNELKPPDGGKFPHWRVRVFLNMRKARAGRLPFYDSRAVNSLKYVFHLCCQHFKI